MMEVQKVVRDERGVAMIMVLGMMSVLTIVVAAALSYAVSVGPQVNRDENWQAALAAAQAGVDDYLAKLNRTDAYALTVDCDNVALRGPDAEANECGWDEDTEPGWVAVQAGNPIAGKFHYDVNTANFWKDGSVWVESTGKVRGVSALSRSGSPAVDPPTSCTTPTSRMPIPRTSWPTHLAEASRCRPEGRATTPVAAVVRAWRRTGGRVADV